MFASTDFGFIPDIITCAKGMTSGYSPLGAMIARDDVMTWELGAHGSTYGGNPLTLLNAISDAAPETRTEVWYLVNPPTGANNVVVTAGGSTPGQNVESVVGATTFSNADQSAPPSVANFGQGSPISTQITGTAATDIVLDFIGVRESVVSTAGGAQTAGYAQTTGTSADDIDGRSSGRLAATPNTTMSWTLNNNRRWTHVVLRVQQRRQRVAQHRVVVRQQDADHRRAGRHPAV